VPGHGVKASPTWPGPLFLSVNWGGGVYSLRDPSPFPERFASAPEILGRGNRSLELSLKIETCFSRQTSGGCRFGGEGAPLGRR